MRRPHRWVEVPSGPRSTVTLGRQMCHRCGLLWLRNPASNALAAQPCLGGE